MRWAFWVFSALLAGITIAYFVDHQWMAGVQSLAIAVLTAYTAWRKIP